MRYKRNGRDIRVREEIFDIGEKTGDMTERGEV